MNREKLRRWKIGLVLTAVMAVAAVPCKALANEWVPAHTTPEQTARWWQWALSIPSSVHPLAEKAADPAGDKYCMVGQEGKEWFLGGTFKVVDVSLESSQSESENGGGTTIQEVVRNCEIPLGKSILIPVLNAECNTAEELALGNTVPQNTLEKAGYLRKCAKSVADHIDKSTAKAFFGPVNSAGNWTKRPAEIKRVYTSLPFSVSYSSDNILSGDCGENGEEPFLCDPDPNPSLAHADGYWAHVLPLSPGKYRLETFGEAPDFDFALKITYTLTVVGPKDQ